MYDYGYSYGYGLVGGNTYNPLINYDWSTTTASGLRYLKDVGSTPAYNASMYFGRGAYLNGVDQTITVPINATIQTALKRVNGVITINETSQTLTNYVISGVGAHKDYYLFTRLLTTAEKDSYTNTPEAFYAMAQADSACVLNMPMCETSSTARNYKTGIDYPISNYTTSVRDNAKNLQYGLQTCKFVRDSLGVIQSASDYLECDGVGYADTGWIPKLTDIFYVETIIENTIGGTYSFSGNALAGGLAIGPSAIDNALFIKIFDVQLHIFSKINPRYHIIAGVSDGKVHLFIDGVFHSSTTVVTTTGSTLPVFLGKLNAGGSNMFTPLRLFKVHTSPQDQLELYNKAVAKGLLS